MTGGPRIAVYGYWGVGNLGNEASLEAVLNYLREHHPDARLSCIGINARAIEQQHGVPAVEMSSYHGPSEATGSLVTVRKAWSRLRDVPRTFAMVGDVDVVVVAGTGALETSLRIPVWGLPYWVFLIAVMCRLRGKKLLILSVGAENPVDPVKRFFFRWTMRMADYCSFRDEKSLAAARAMGVRKKLDGVFPDLAFALPTPPAQAVRPGHVTIGVMAYTGRADERFPVADRHDRYVVHLTRLIERLLDDGGTVTMVIGDRADLAAGEEILRAVKAARPSAPVCLQGSEDLGEVMEEMAHAEVVVASRFHSVICGLKMAKPTVSLGYANKHADLTTRFGLAEFNLSLDSPDVETLLCHIAEARSRTPELEPRMTEVLGQFRAELGTQFALISAEFFGGREQSGLASGGSRC